jgi:hypothetical protein
MSRRNRRKKEVAYPAVAVFAFTRNAEFRNSFYQKESFNYFMKIIDSMMTKNHVSSEKVGFSGYKEDIAAFFSQAIDLYMSKHIDVELVLDTNEFDPEYVPNKYR